MATAVALNATSSILNGQGLSASPALLANIATYQAKPALASFANCYVNAGIAPAVTANIVTELNTIGSSITSGHFLLDLYPANVTPTCSATITPWTANTVIAVGNLISNSGKVYTVTGNVFGDSFSGNVLQNCTITGFSGLLKKQAQLPFASGLSGFANVVTNSYAYSQQIFDTVSSVQILKQKTYRETGVGFTGPLDLVTGGIGTNANLIANVISSWGTMYDINNISRLSDVYVFGQNLLNQGLGYISSLSDQLINVGLDITNLTNVVPYRTTITQEEQVKTVSSAVGEIEVPIMVEVVSSVPVTGSSPNVVTNIYRTVTSANLQAMVNATGISTATANSSELISLADYLDFNKVVRADLASALSSALNITSFATLSQYLSSKIGQGRFRSWRELADWFRSFETPALTNLATGANTNILYSSTVSTLESQYGVGSGALGNPIMIDYLGACAGDPYTIRFGTISSNYNTLAAAAGITTPLANLDRAIIDYSNAYLAYLGSEIPESSPGAGDGTPPNPALLLPFSIVTSNVTAVNSALSSLPTTGALADTVAACNTGWYVMLNRVSAEVANLVRAGVVFGPGTAGGLLSFAERIGQLASNKTDAQTYQFFANVITNDAAGDSIRAVVAETINNKILGRAGIISYNDPDPRLKVVQSDSQNIPLSTYITLNK